MSSQNDKNTVIRIDLTAQQKEKVKAELGRDAEALELTVRELEERIAPRLASNHNETLLVGDIG